MKPETKTIDIHFIDLCAEDENSELNHHQPMYDRI